MEKKGAGGVPPPPPPTFSGFFYIPPPSPHTHTHFRTKLMVCPPPTSSVDNQAHSRGGGGGVGGVATPPSGISDIHNIITNYSTYSKKGHLIVSSTLRLHQKHGTRIFHTPFTIWPSDRLYVPSHPRFKFSGSATGSY